MQNLNDNIVCLSSEEVDLATDLGLTPEEEKYYLYVELSCRTVLFKL